jgi:hypothetical protein
MTNVYCDRLSCKYNKEAENTRWNGICTKEDIQLIDDFDTGMDCQDCKRGWEG